MIKKKQLIGSVGKRFSVHRHKLKTNAKESAKLASTDGFKPHAGTHFNDIDELLTITMEECGELIQACSKAIRCESYHDNAALIEEIGDVACMLELLHGYDLVSHQQISDRINQKKKKLKRWSNLL